MNTSWALAEANRLRAEAEGWRHVRERQMEDGTIPSALYVSTDRLDFTNKRIEVLAHQVHPVVGERYRVMLHGVTWVLAADLRDVRGTPRESIVPAGMFETDGAK